MTTVGDLGEKAFIAQVLSRHALTARPQARDDCIVIDPARLFGGDGLPYIVYSIDHPSLPDRPLPEGFEWRYLGRWIAACTCNDVLAMGAKPMGFSLDLAVPAHQDVASIDQLYDGIQDVLGTYDARFEGGNVDINSLVETVGMCWGAVQRAGIVRRRGARPGDLIAVTTELGLGWAGYILFKEGKLGLLRPESRAAFEAYNLLPIAPHHRAIVEAVERLPGAITSGMDLSDGIAEYLHHIAETEGHGIAIDQSTLGTLPIHDECARLLDVPAWTLAIELGFDMPRGHGYTVDAERWDEVAGVFAAHGAPLHQLGRVTSAPGVNVVTDSGTTWPVPRIWDDKCEPTRIDRWRSTVCGSARPATYFPREGG